MIMISLKVLEDRVADGRRQASTLQQTRDSLQAKLDEMQADLQRSESKSNQLELQLQSSKRHMESDSSADNYLREELGKVWREADQSRERLREMKKTVRA